MLSHTRREGARLGRRPLHSERPASRLRENRFGGQADRRGVWKEFAERQKRLDVV
jgi:hypothetical protein